MPRRRAVPPPVSPESLTVSMNNANEIIRKLIVETEAGAYGISIDGVNVRYIWQTVPGYSRDISFYSGGNRDRKFFTIDLSNESEVELDLVKSHSGSKLVTITTKHKSCKIQHESSRSIDMVVADKRKSFTFVFEKLKTKQLVCFNGKLN